MTFRKANGDLDITSIVLISLATIVILMVVLPLFGVQYANWLGWQLEPYQRTSVGNVKQEYERFHDQAGLLKSQYANIETAQAKVKAFGDPNNLYGTQKAAYLEAVQNLANAQDAYNYTCGQYQAAWDNQFHSSVAPTNIPRDCELVRQQPGP